MEFKQPLSYGVCKDPYEGVFGSSFLRGLTKPLYIGVSKASCLGALQSPYLGALQNLSTWDFMKLLSESIYTPSCLSALQSPWDFAMTLTEGLYKAPWLSASQSPVPEGFAKPFTWVLWKVPTWVLCKHYLPGSFVEPLHEMMGVQVKFQNVLYNHINCADLHRKIIFHIPTPWTLVMGSRGQVQNFFARNCMTCPELQRKGMFLTLIPMRVSCREVKIPPKNLAWKSIEYADLHRKIMFRPSTPIGW